MRKLDNSKRKGNNKLNFALIYFQIDEFIWVKHMQVHQRRK